jgi:hypothetical protein
MAMALWLVSTSSMADTTKDQCVDANAKAQDLRRDGKLTAAGEQLRQCASPACPAMVRDDCSRRLDELERAQPSIVFDVKDGAGADVIAVKIRIDGQPLADHLDGKPLKVDPGAHTFSFEVAGQAAVTKQLLVNEGETGRQERIVLGSGAAPMVAAPTSSVPPPPTETSTASSSSAPHETPASGPGTQRALGLTLGGVGVVGVGLGVAFGLMASSAWSSAKSACLPGGPSMCSGNVSAANADHSAAVTDGTIATVGFIAGGLLVATGAILFFTGHHETSPAPSLALTPIVGPRQAGIGLSGGF